MDQDYIQRLKNMLADAERNIASVDDIQDPQEREVKKGMFAESKKEIEALLKQAQGSSKKSSAKKPAKAKKKAPAKKKTTKKVAKKPAAKKTTKKVAKKSAPKKTVKKAAPKKKVAKKTVKKAAPKKAKKVSKPAAKKTAPKKATKKAATKKVTKKPAAKKATKKVAKDVTVKEFPKKVKKPAKRKASVKKASTADDAEAVFSNESKSDLKKNKKESVKEKKSSEKKIKAAKKQEKESVKVEKKLEKGNSRSNKDAKADANVDANIYMSAKPDKSDVNKPNKDLADAVNTFESETKQEQKELKVEEKEYKKAKKWEKKDEKKEFAQPENSNSAQPVLDKKAIKEAKKQEKLAKKAEKKAAKEYKKVSKQAEKEVNKTVSVNGYDIPVYTDEIGRIRNVENIPAFGSQHTPMSEEDLALNTIYSDMFETTEKVSEKKKSNISVAAYNDANYEDAIPTYKDTTSTPTAKVGIEAGPLTNGPVAIPTDAADAVNPNGPTAEPVKEEKVEAPKVEAQPKPAKASKPAKAEKVEAPKPVEQPKPEVVEQAEKPVEQPAAEVKAAPEVVATKPVVDKKAIKEAKKQEKLAKKAEKKAAKEYEKISKEAAKAISKPDKINGYEIPVYTDEIGKIRDVNNLPEFGTQHNPMTAEDLAMNSLYAQMFEITDKVSEKKTKVSVSTYNDANYDDAIAPYKDTTSTPTAKVGIEAGPLTNGPVAIPTDAADAVNPNGPTIEPAKEEKVEAPKVEEQSKPTKAPKKAKAEKVEQPKVETKPTDDNSKKIAELQAQLAAMQGKQEEQPKEETLVSDPKKEAKLAKQRAKAAKKQAKEEEKLAKKQQKEAEERETEMRRKQEEDKLRIARANADEIAKKQKEKDEKQKEKEAEINRLADEASAKAAKQQKEEAAKAEKEEAKSEKKAAKENKQELAADNKDKSQMSDEDKRIAEQASKRAEIKKGEFIKVDLPPIPDEGVKSLKQIAKRQKQLTSKYSKQILEGAIVTTTDYKPEVSKHVIELHDVVKSYITGDIETPVLKGVNLKLNKGDFIVILGPSGSGKTTFLNTISGLDKATKGDVFVLGYNLSYLKDSHLTKFRRKHVGFIFQQYNLLTNLTAKENAEVGENLAASKNKDMTIEDIFETIGMKTQMNKYPHQMSGGQQQRVSIARALAKNPDILFADEPTGALDEEMGRKVLEILVEVNKRYGTTVIVVTHNPNIAKIGNTVIHIRNGKVEEVEANQKPADPATIEWA